ncbi:MAG: hypothetical protein O3C28_20750, partial [Proteobacteria bacterium]|nr:hypothetical protein [Pseudomonadota bacterium]
MRKTRRNLELFSLSFLDIVSCGFGAVVLLVLISKTAENEKSSASTEVSTLLQQVLGAEDAISSMNERTARIRSEIKAKQTVLDSLKKLKAKTNVEIEQASKINQRALAEVEGLELVQQSLNKLKIASIRPQSTMKRDEEVGGIPVDSDYVVFIVDTSGSMKQIWGRVTAEIENVIRIHPKVRGFQILNDNGAHLLSGYTGRWIPDTPGRRANAIKLFGGWNSASNSSPVEGLQVALKRYVNPNTKVSIYIFGDEYSGSSYEPVINALRTLNTNRIKNKNLARIHAVGFISSFSTGRFAILMREVTRQN